MKTCRDCKWCEISYDEDEGQEDAYCAAPIPEWANHILKSNEDSWSLQGSFDSYWSAGVPEFGGTDKWCPAFEDKK